jgi:hypothetical protein
MATLGPIYDAAHSGATVGGAVFSVGAGPSVLIYGWFRYLRPEDGKSKTPLVNMIGFSLICCTMIGIGVWEWVHALRISH